MSEITPATPAAIAPAGTIDLSAAIQAAAGLGKDGVEVLERLHAIAKDERASNARAAFYKAIAELHGRIGSIPKNRTASFATKTGTKVSYRYADLHAVASALRKHTGPLGLAWRWGTSGDEGGVTVTCTASHRDGHSESSTWRAPIEGGNPLTSAPQKAKIATTFAQRVTLIQVFGLTDTEDDVDGALPDADGGFDDEGGSPDTIDGATAANIGAMLDESPDPAGERKRFLGWLGVPSVDAIPASRAREAVAAIEAKRRKGWKS